MYSRVSERVCVKIRIAYVSDLICVSMNSSLRAFVRESLRENTVGMKKACNSGWLRVTANAWLREGLREIAHECV